MSNCKAMPKWSRFRWAHRTPGIFLHETIFGAEPREAGNLNDAYREAAWAHLDPTGTAPSVCADAVRTYYVGA